jgi:hypothetical protein
VNVSGSGLGATIEHLEPFLAGRDLLHASLTCRALHETVTGDKRLRGIMLHSARAATLDRSGESTVTGWRAVWSRPWGIDPVDFASAILELVFHWYQLERGALCLLHVSFEAVVSQIMEVARRLLGTAKRPDPFPPAHETAYPYSVRVTLADLNAGLRLCLWGGGPFVDKTDVVPEELRRFKELDRGIIRLARRAGVLEFEPCLFGFVGALLGRYVEWIVTGAKTAGVARDKACEEGPTPVERVNRVLGAVHRTMGSTRLLDAGGAPVGGKCALEPAAFEQMIDELEYDGAFETNFDLVPPFGYLWYLHAALNREVEEVLAFVAAATRDITDADASEEVLPGFYPGRYRDEGMDALFYFSPWRRAMKGSSRPADLELGCDPLRASLALAIRRAGIRERLVEDCLDCVGSLVVAYIKAMLIYWEATQDDDEEAGAEDAEPSDDEPEEDDNEEEEDNEEEDNIVEEEDEEATGEEEEDEDEEDEEEVSWEKESSGAESWGEELSEDFSECDEDFDHVDTKDEDDDDETDVAGGSYV